MENVRILAEDSLGRDFIPYEFLPRGEDEYYLRNRQVVPPPSGWRHLRADEVERLVKNNNTASGWDEVLVTDPFDTNQIKNTDFYGLVRIGAVRNIVLEHHDLKAPAGITNSVIIASDIGNDAALHNVRYLAHYIIGDRCVLLNLDEMHTTDHAKFGNGTVKEGEPESVRVWLDVMNETGGRRILPFDGMLPADAYLWAKYRDDAALQENLLRMTQQIVDPRRGWYGTVGDQTVIKNCRILKDAKVGSCCYIKGANKLKNLTINSSEDEPTQIGEGVELVNGIIGYGCKVFYGCKAVRFILTDHSNLKYGARLINSLLGENSTISCCEVLNNLIFPGHEQHHNNSFLVASLVLGQSNMAAGVTIGSNHNSRANDNEIEAGRGFWPGLCTSLKHPSKFASFTLLSKADYQYELNIMLPFSLVANDPARDRLTVMPAYWWLYNMYALARNTWKLRDRDKRKNKNQHIEFDFLAPDTAEEIACAMGLLEEWTGKAVRGGGGTEPETALRKIGSKLLKGPAEPVDNLIILGEGMEKSKRQTVILKVRPAYSAYKEMLLYYAVKNIMRYLEDYPDVDLEELNRRFTGKRITEWGNLGGQIVQRRDIARLKKDVGTEKLYSWNAVHKRYDELWEKYSSDKTRHAFALLKWLLGARDIDENQWVAALDRAVQIQEYIGEQVYVTRKKDFDNQLRKNLFNNEAEQVAVIGTIDDNSFVKQVREETKLFKGRVAALKERQI